MNQLPKEPDLQLLRINRGISQFNHDYYAALGLPIITSPIYIRHVYLSIARILHPDVYGFSAKEKAVATQYLAKLVNPAYDILMKEEERKAYQGIFKLLAKRLMQKSRNVQIHSALACEFMLAPSDGYYERSVSAIAKLQYQSLDNILEYTAQISELNLVYILYKEGYQYGDPDMPPVLEPMVQKPLVMPTYPQSLAKSSYAYPTSSSSSHKSPNSPSSDETIIQTRIEPRDPSAIADRLKICEIYMSQGDWKAALKDLREILQLDKNSSKCHAMLGVVYKNIDQPQMAKVSLMRSLQINPQEPLALKHIKDLSNPNSAQSATAKKLPKPSPTKKPLIAPPQKRGWLSNLLGWSDDK